MTFNFDHKSRGIYIMLETRAVDGPGLQRAGPGRAWPDTLIKTGQAGPNMKTGRAGPENSGPSSNWQASCNLK